MSDALTSRAAREYRDERDRQERTKGVPRLAMLHSAPPPQSEGDYGEQAPSAPFDEVAPEGERSESVELPVISAASFAGRDPPARPWIVRDMIPDRTVTIVSGDGGGGKTTLMLQLATAISGSCPWLGHNPDPGPVLVVTAEDDEEEIHRRLGAISKSLGVELADLADLHIVPLAGQDAVMGAPEGRAAIITPTAVFRALGALVERHQAAPRRPRRPGGCLRGGGERSSSSPPVHRLASGPRYQERPRRRADCSSIAHRIGVG
jgi:hypothetical protein